MADPGQFAHHPPDQATAHQPMTNSNDDTGGAPVFSQDWDDSADRAAYDANQKGAK